ncbi:uncharacterized protein LOC131672905 isoform X1 [Phymastichus coffea]|uniref:uncharacterized protein LOC131672905 isoform X1 n=1 Tax=Phymastichus coffea TaxID=108790 RepID=UPI00273CF133|nr:uncharacterized protein LOC131672905 isoform X1 [Phymastichus coffea]XP_058806422.1 uncharacterized protein LOC131672905 isoform X1 [Phymastichus coffea]
MAAQVNNVQPFVSCNAYYGYLPINTQQQQQSQPQTLINNDIGMDVDNESCLARVQNNSNNIVQQKQQTHEFFMSVEEDHWRRSQGRKRVFDKDEVANYMPRFKKFRTGDCILSEERRLAQVYHEPLLCLSPAADSDMLYEESTIMGKFKIQPVTSISRDTRCQELEDMLLLTHGCSSYHHMSQSGYNEEAEF